MSNYKQALVRVRFYRDPGMHKSGKKKTRKIENAVRYITFRSRELHENKEYGLFGKDTDYANIRDFLDKIKSDKAIKHPRAVKAHELVISFRQDDYNRLGIDYKKLTRQIMSELEKKKGMKLEWVASEHLRVGHPHVHIIIKSTGIDQEGKTRRLKLDIPRKDHAKGKVNPLAPNDMKFIKDKIDEFTGRKELEKKEQALQEVTHTMKGFLNELTKEIKRGMVRSEYEQEQSKKQFIRQVTREVERAKRNREGLDR